MSKINSMSPNPISLRPDMNLLELRKLRRGQRIRRQPFTDTNGRLVGTVCAGVQTDNLHAVHHALRAAGLSWGSHKTGAPAP